MANDPVKAAVLKHFGDGTKEVGTDRQTYSSPVGDPVKAAVLKHFGDGTKEVGTDRQREENPTERETGFWHTWFGDALQRVNAGAADMAGGIAMGINEVGQLPNYAYNYAKTGEWEAPGKENTWLGKAAEYFKNDAEYSRERSTRYGTVTEVDEKGNKTERPKNFKDLWKEGDYTGVAGDLFLTASESLPGSLMAGGVGGITKAAVLGKAGLSALRSGMAAKTAESAALAASTGVMGVTPAIEKWDQLSQDNPDMPWYNRAVNAGATGAFEGLSEGLGALFDIKLLKTLYEGAGINRAKNIFLNTLLGTLKESKVEGAEEAANTVTENVTDYITGATDKFEPFKGVPEAFVYGVAGGMQFAGPVGVASAVGQRRQQQYVDGLITDAVNVDRYFDFNSLSKEDKQAIQQGYGKAEERLKRAMENGSPEAFQAALNIIGMSGNEQRKALRDVAGSTDLNESQKLSIFNYVQKGNARRGMEAAVQSRMETAQRQAFESLRPLFNTDMNAIVTARVNGRQRQITAGKIILSEDGKIDLEKSDKMVYYPDENGKKQVVATGMIDLEEIIPAEDAIREAVARASETVVAGHENDLSPDIETGETVRTREGMTGTVTGKNEDGTYRVSIPGVPQPLSVEPRRILQNLRGVENGSTVDYTDTDGSVKTGEVEDTGLFETAQRYVIDGKEIAAEQILGLHRENQNGTEIPQPGQTDNGLTPETPENADASPAGEGKATETDEQKRLFYESLPKNSKGEMNENAMTDAQKIRHLEYKRGIEFSVNAARKGKQNTETEIKKLQSRFEKESDPLKLDKLQDQIDFLAERVKTYSDYISGYQKAKMQENVERAAGMQEQEAERKRLLEERERQEAERREQDALEKEQAAGVPDVSRDTAANARRRGYRLSEGTRIDRQPEMSDIKGTPAERKFSDTETVPATRTVVDAGMLQPSHKSGSRNHRFFITEAQPKERTDDATFIAAQNIARNINPQEITGGTTAYTGSPVINTRGEVIQGNNRTAALQQMYEQFPEQAARYRQYLAEHAADYGMTAEEVMSMERPVAADVISVSDEQAIRLGQLNAADTESGGVQRIQPRQVATTLGESLGRFTQILFDNNTGEDLSVGELVHKNAGKALDFLIAKGIVNNTQYQSAFDKRQNITPEAKADLTGIATQSLFSGAGDTFAQRFDMLPAKAKAAILQTVHRDLQSSDGDKITDDIRQAVEAYSMLSHDAAFADAQTEADARSAVWAWSRQVQMDFSEGNFVPAEKYNNFALELAVRFRAHSMATQRQMFNALYDSLQGRGGDLYTQSEKLEKKEAIKKHFNTEYNGQLQGSHALADNGRDGTAGKQGSTGKLGNGEQNQAGVRDSDGGGGTVRDNIERVEIQPTGKGAFGNIYDQFRGKAKEAINFLSHIQGGDAVGVFNREELGDIDLVWGNKEENQGVEHIIDKHVIQQNDFNSIEEAADIIDDVIAGGTVIKTKPDKATFEKDGYKVVVSKNVRDSQGNVIQTKNWVVTAFDITRKASEKKNASPVSELYTAKTTEAVNGQTTPPNEASYSADKDTANNSKVTTENQNNNNNLQENGNDSNGSLRENGGSGQGVPADNRPDVEEINDGNERLGTSVGDLREVERENGKETNPVGSETEPNPDAPEAKWTEENGETAETNNPAETQGKNAAAEELKPAPKTPAQMLEEAGGSIVKMTEAVVKQAEIAKAEKQVNTNPIAEYKSNIRSHTEQAEDLEAVNEQFNEELSEFDNKTLKGELHLGKPLSILKAAGLKDGEMTVTQKTLRDHIKNHGLTSEDLKGLAKAIQKPLLVYNWGKNHPATTIVTELETKDGRKITVGIRLENKGNDMTVNEIATIHGKTNDRLIEDWLKSTPEELTNEKIKWVEKEKVLSWLGSSTVGNAQAEGLNSITKVIQDFENPTLSTEKSHVSDKKMRPVPANGFEKLIERLKETGLARNVIVEKTAMREYLAKHSDVEVRPMSTSKGEIYGFTTPEGDVYLDPDKMNANTPIHEFGHLFWSAAMPAETKAKITELLKQTPGWKSLSDNPAYANLKTDDQKADELFNTLLGNYGEYSPQVRAIMGDNIGLFARIQNAISEFLEWLKATVFGNTDAKLNVFAKKTLNELLSSKPVQTERLENPAESNTFAENNEVNSNDNTKNKNISDAQRIAANAIMPRHANSVSEAQDLIRPLVGKPITNSKLGITGTLSGNSVSKLGSQKATKKSVSPALHAKAIANIDILFQNAEFDVTHLDDKGVYEVEKVHRLGSLMFDEATGEYVPVMLTVKEFNNPKGNRIYSIEAVDIEAKEKSAGQMVVDRQSPLQQTPIADFANHESKEVAISDFNAKIQQLIEIAKQTEEKTEENSSDAENNEVNGNEEKKKRIEKLRNSSPIEITGEEITPSEDLKEYKANALEYGKSLRGEYTNKDTNERVKVVRSGIKEVLRHDGGDIAHIQSVAAIPQIIENSIYIDTIENENPEKTIKEYRYYVAGLKIGDTDYTVKAAIAVDENGNRYYDHALTQIEKGKLLDYAARVTSTPPHQGVSNFDSKDKRLLSILQTNEEKKFTGKRPPFPRRPRRKQPEYPIRGTRRKNKQSYIQAARSVGRPTPCSKALP